MTVTSPVLIVIICLLFVVVLALAIVMLRRRRKSSSVEYINEQVYVGNLPYHVNEDHLRDYFRRFGNIQSVRIIRNARTGRSKGFAFVTYSDESEASSALASHGKDMSGRTMVVRIAKPRQN